MMKNIFSLFLDFFFPPTCPICHELVTEKGEWCGRCVERALLLRQIYLPRPRFKYLTACVVLCLYRQGVKNILHRIKFQQNLRDIPQMDWLLREKTAAFPPWTFDFVSPVPLHQARIKKRGFNQSAIIFQNWVQARGWTWKDSLIRHQQTLPQYQLNKTERWKNVQDAFAARDAQAISGKSLLLVDDIFTTGATMEACAKALVRAGAKEVFGFALAADTK